MPSQVDICNLALGYIGQRPISDINDTTSNQAIACRAVWDSCLQECLRGHDWGFATVEEPLALISGYTPKDFLYAYAYPTNCMGFWKVSNSNTVDKLLGEKFRRIFVRSLNTNVIVTNCPQAYGEYTYLVTDTTLFDANFVTTLAYRIAAAIAMPLNVEENQAITMSKMFMNSMSEAERMDSVEQNVDERQQTSAFEDARG